jgi:hypothetical protein
MPYPANQAIILALIMHVSLAQALTQLGSHAQIILMHFPANLALSFSMEYASFVQLSTLIGLPVQATQ